MDAQQPPDAQEVDPHPPLLVNDNPLFKPFSTVVGFIEGYGWILLLGVVVCLYLRSKLAPKYNSYRQRVEDERESKKFDVNKAQSKLEAMEASRRRMQDQLDAQAALHAEQTKIKEEEKRQQKIADWDGHQQGKGYRSKYKPTEEKEKPSKPLPKSKTLRQQDYNPLAGDGGSCAWRPGPRQGGAGGG